MEENNEGFGIAFATIIFVAFILPSIVLLSVGDTWDRFIDKYGSAATTECWENSKHEKVCRSDKKCSFGRLFCIEEGFRWKLGGQNKRVGREGGCQSSLGREERIWTLNRLLNLVQLT